MNPDHLVAWAIALGLISIAVGLVVGPLITLALRWLEGRWP